MRPIYPTFQPTAKRLADEAFMVMTGMLRLFLGLEMSLQEEQTFNAFRELALETLPDEAKPE
ncbi:MAG: hypothetical protein HY644_14940 [Acidobacteria bacterium]|nr:hypothetical protein [Acidobacteriota bacterium]